MARVLQVILLVICFRVGTEACEPEFYYLFNGEARAQLDAFSVGDSGKFVFERFVLLHNLAFHKDKEAREAAEKLFARHFKDSLRVPLYRAYDGSLAMIKVSHRSLGGKVFQVLNPFARSPHAEARAAFQKITEGLSAEPNNRVLRMLRATAATESVEHLNELFDIARIDLQWLTERNDDADSVSTFLLFLNWAKYHYKLSLQNGSEGERLLARAAAEKAARYACTGVYERWAQDWQARIKSSALETE